MSVAAAGNELRRLVCFVAFRLRYFLNLYPLLSIFSIMNVYYMQERLTKACDTLLEKQSDATDAKRWRGLTHLVRYSMVACNYYN
jgi:hypothetical protein